MSSDFLWMNALTVADQKMLEGSALRLRQFAGYARTACQAEAANAPMLCNNWRHELDAMTKLDPVAAYLHAVHAMRSEEAGTENFFESIARQKARQIRYENKLIPLAP
jgi:hypothetical protein